VVFGRVLVVVFITVVTDAGRAIVVGKDNRVRNWQKLNVINAVNALSPIASKKAVTFCIHSLNKCNCHS